MQFYPDMLSAMRMGHALLKVEDITSHFPCISAVCTSKEAETNRHLTSIYSEDKTSTRWLQAMTCIFIFITFYDARQYKQSECVNWTKRFCTKWQEGIKTVISHCPSKCSIWSCLEAALTCTLLLSWIYQHKDDTVLMLRHRYIVGLVYLDTYSPNNDKSFFLCILCKY